MDDCAHYVCLTHFAFTPLDDSTHLRCYYTPTVSFVLHHCTFPRIYVCTTHFAFTLLDDSMHLRCYCTPTQFCFTPLYDSTHLRCYCMPTGSFVLCHCTFLRIYVSTAHCFYTTGRFYASTMLLYADWQFCFTPLYVSTHLRFYGSLCFYTTGRFYASTMLLYADAQFCFTPLYDSTHLRCYCTPTGSFVLYHCTFLYASTFLRLTLGLHHSTILRIYDATVRRLSVLFYTTVRFYACTFLRLTLHCNSVLNRNPGLNRHMKRNKIELRNRFTYL